MVSYVPQVREEQYLPVWVCMCGSTHVCGCVVDGNSAMAALEYYYHMKLKVTDNYYTQLQEMYKIL